jgi:glycosyltransferase involved in cell wall biosynthesis
LKVLYLNHTALMSGAERSLLTVIEGLPDDVEPFVACPSGALSEAVRDLGVATIEVFGTAGSLKFHPFHTPRTVFDLARTALETRSAARRVGADLVDANSTRAGLAAFASSLPTVVHVRDRLPRGLLAEATLRTLVGRARVLMANSDYTASRIPPGNAEVRVIPNSINLERFNPDTVDPHITRARLGIDEADCVLAVIGQITPWKGQDLAIRVAGALSGGAPVRLLIAGSPKFTSSSTRFDNRAYLAGLHRLVKELGLGDSVRFLGDREDIPEILAATDVVLLPSWEEPFGLAVIEAMAMGVPVIATEVGGPAEIISGGADGLLLPPHRHEPWAEAVRGLIAAPERLVEIGRRGREKAVASFGVERHLEAVLAAYECALRPSQSGMGRLTRIRHR